MKARSTHKLPDPKTLYHHFGGKKTLAARLRDFFQDKNETEFAALCASVAESAKESEESPSGAATQVEFGFVYLMKSGRYYKLGRTNAVGRRQWELGLQLPERVRIIYSFKTDDPAGIEAYWHQRFAHRRKNGEWFDLTTLDVAAFKRRKFM